MVLESIWSNFGVPIISAVLSIVTTGGVLKWLFDRDLERYKGTLKASSDADLEIQRANLRRVTDEYLGRSAALRAEHGTKLFELYAAIVRVERSLNDLGAIVRINDGKTDEERASIVAQRGNEMRDAFRENRLFLPRSVAAKIEAFDEHAGAIHHAWLGARVIIPGPQTEEALWEARRRLDDMHGLRMQIEDDFRVLLGVPESL